MYFHLKALEWGTKLRPFQDQFDPDWLADRGGGVSEVGGHRGAISGTMAAR